MKTTTTSNVTPSTTTLGTTSNGKGTRRQVNVTPSTPAAAPAALTQGERKGPAPRICPVTLKAFLDSGAIVNATITDGNGEVLATAECSPRAFGTPAEMLPGMLGGGFGYNISGKLGGDVAKASGIRLVLKQGTVTVFDSGTVKQGMTAEKPGKPSKPNVNMNGKGTVTVGKVGVVCQVGGNFTLGKGGDTQISVNVSAVNGKYAPRE